MIYQKNHKSFSIFSDDQTACHSIFTWPHKKKEEKIVKKSFGYDEK